MIDEGKKCLIIPNRNYCEQNRALPYQRINKSDAPALEVIPSTIARLDYPQRTIERTWLCLQRIQHTAKDLTSMVSKFRA